MAETTTTWGITIKTKILGNDVTFKSSSKNSKRFEMENFVVNDEKLTTAFEDLGISIPPELFDFMPDKTEVRKLVIDGSTSPPFMEMEFAMELGELLDGKLDNLIVVQPKTVRLYIKKEPDKN